MSRHINLSSILSLPQQASVTTVAFAASFVVVVDACLHAGVPHLQRRGDPRSTLSGLRSPLRGQTASTLSGLFAAVQEGLKPHS